MLSHRRVVHPQETYRFSMTRTLSDYPLLIGEILRRDHLRAIQQTKRHSFLVEVGRALGIRVPRIVGKAKSSVLTGLT
jgi:hypothetical protein